MLSTFKSISTISLFYIFYEIFLYLCKVCRSYTSLACLDIFAFLKKIFRPCIIFDVAFELIIDITDTVSFTYQFRETP